MSNGLRLPRSENAGMGGGTGRGGAERLGVRRCIQGSSESFRNTLLPWSRRRRWRPPRRPRCPSTGPSLTMAWSPPTLVYALQLLLTVTHTAFSCRQAPDTLASCAGLESSLMESSLIHGVMRVGVSQGFHVTGLHPSAQWEECPDLHPPEAYLSGGLLISPS